MTNLVPDDPYTLLGLTREADEAAVKQAYFSKVREYPPERDPAMFKRVRTAYDQLRDPEKRVAADLRLLELWTVPPAPARPLGADLKLDPADIFTVVESESDLALRDWRADFREVSV